MNNKPHRIVVPFCDRWAEPEPNGAVTDGIRRALCEPMELLNHRQQQTVLISDYMGEIGCGGHDQYFFNLHSDIAACVPATIESLREFGLMQAADILSRAYDRWSSHERPILKNIEEVSEMFMQEEFDDLDDEYFDLAQSGPSEQPDLVMQAFLAANEALFVELPPPTAEDQCLVEMGNPAMHPDGGRAAWRSLAGHPSPRVRLRAATSLLDTDRKRAISLGLGVYGDPHADDWVINHALNFLYRARASRKAIKSAQRRRHAARSWI